MGRRREVAAAAPSAGGFTLLELVVVLFVVGLAVGLVAPALGRGADGLRARAQVAGFSAALRHARELAITTHTRHAVVVDPEAHRLTINTDGGDVRESRALPPRLAVEATPPPALTVTFEPQGSASGGDFRLTSGGVTYRVTVDALTGRVRALRE